jgi:hypothetical protein
MLLSKCEIAALCDLIENRLAIMTVHDQDDLREKLALQHALTELKGTDTVHDAVLNDFSEIPRRGRRRKVGGLAEA